ncbi:type VI secretion system baseplate subunit TssG [Pyxidicoccus trucidator]|uniref:type VI secretion system baseplate subunit TssG n=1 Tax=Pyxidicoccus trucidator TaxID=2709662 RepID=UPI001F07DFF8|nr:type VI secretion system baseplate subunit TssG [Pyxidicoccus trucidator]
MDTAQRREDDLLAATAQQLAPQASQFGFFELVAYLERLTPDAVRVGDLGPVLEERIRFRHDPSLAFASGDVSAVTLRQMPARPDVPDSKRPLFEVVTTFLGLTGASSPLPSQMAEEVAQEDPDHPVRREFLDLFHHRLLSLLFRVLCRYRVTSELTSDCTDEWSRRMLSLAGLDTYEKERPGTLPPWRLLRIAHLLACHTRSAERLELALTDLLGEHLGEARVTVNQFVGRWVDIDARTQLGRAHRQLGRNFLLGSKAVDRMGRFQIEIGPLPPRTWQRLLPEGDLFPQARELVELFIRDPLEYSFELFLAESVQQSFQLTSNEPRRLGRDTWIGTNRRMHVSVPGSS